MGIFTAPSGPFRTADITQDAAAATVCGRVAGLDIVAIRLPRRAVRPCHGRPR